METAKFEDQEEFEDTEKEFEGMEFEDQDQAPILDADLLPLTLQAMSWGATSTKAVAAFRPCWLPIPWLRKPGC